MNDPANTLSEIAPTLADLKKLPMGQKMRLLLARLKKIGRDESSLNKHNLSLQGDPYGLAYGYPDEEKKAVKEHLLGTPWTKLVNEGYLVDLSGQGFHKVSEEGDEFLKQEPPQPTSVPAPVPESILFGAATDGIPRAFISYSWEGPEHQEWVFRLATRLQEDGIEIIFDRWHLHPGQEKQHFMEQAVTKSDFVVVICTENYATRANNREGGVGYESMIITSEMADHILTRKFIPVLKSGGFKNSLPLYIKGRMGVDLSGTPYREDEYERLIRVLHGESIQPPPIGKKPVFLRGSTPKIGVSTASPSASSPVADQKPSSSILGPPNKRPNAFAHAQYDKPGLAEPWVSAHARLWERDGKREYSFETSRGDEFLGTKDEVISRFFEFNRGLLKEGYRRMGFTPGPDPDFSVLT
jgi:TIR domain